MHLTNYLSLAILSYTSLTAAAASAGPDADIFIHGELGAPSDYATEADVATSADSQGADATESRSPPKDATTPWFRRAKPPTGGSVTWGHGVGKVVLHGPEESETGGHLHEPDSGSEVRHLAVRDIQGKKPKGTYYDVPVKGLGGSGGKHPEVKPIPVRGSGNGQGPHLFVRDTEGKKPRDTNTIAVKDLGGPAVGHLEASPIPVRGSRRGKGPHLVVRDTESRKPQDTNTLPVKGLGGPAVGHLEVSPIPVRGSRRGKGPHLIVRDIEGKKPHDTNTLPVKGLGSGGGHLEASPIPVRGKGPHLVVRDTESRKPQDTNTLPVKGVKAPKAGHFEVSPIPVAGKGPYPIVLDNNSKKPSKNALKVPSKGHAKKERLGGEQPWVSPVPTPSSARPPLDVMPMNPLKGSKGKGGSGVGRLVVRAAEIAGPAPMAPMAQEITHRRTKAYPKPQEPRLEMAKPHADKPMANYPKPYPRDEPTHMGKSGPEPLLRSTQVPGANKPKEPINPKEHTKPKEPPRPKTNSRIKPHPEKAGVTPTRPGPMRGEKPEFGLPGGKGHSKPAVPPHRGNQIEPPFRGTEGPGHRPPALGGPPKTKPQVKPTLPKPEGGVRHGERPRLGKPGPSLGKPEPRLGKPEPRQGKPEPRQGKPGPLKGSPIPRLGAPYDEPFTRGKPIPNPTMRAVKKPRLSDDDPAYGVMRGKSPGGKRPLIKFPGDTYGWGGDGEGHVGDQG